MDSSKKSMAIGIGLSAIAPILWGIMYPVGKLLIIKGVEPFALATIRTILAGIFYVIADIQMKRKEGENNTRIPLREIWIILLIGMLGFGLTPSLQLYGTKLTTAHYAALVLSLTPLALLLSMRVILGVKVSPAIVFMSLASMIGLMIASNIWSTMGTVHPLGILALLGSCMTWSLYSTLSQPFFERYSPWNVMKYCALGGFIIQIPLSWSTIHTLAFGWTGLGDIAMMIYVGVFSTGVAYLCWNAAIRYSGPGIPALLYFLQPIFATIFGVLMLDEQLSASFLLGGAEMLFCVALGVFLHYRGISNERRDFNNN